MTTGKGRVGLLIGAFIAVLLVLGLGVGYFAAGVAVAANDRANAEKAVSEAVKDNDRIYVLLKNSPSIPTSFNTPDDYAKAKATTDEYGAKATQARGIIDTNLPRLRQASATLRAQTGDFVVATQRGTLDKERARVESIITAFTAGGEGLQVLKDQMVFASAAFDVEGALAALIPVLTKGDVNGALSMYAPLDSKIPQAITLSKGPNIPPQLQTLMTQLATLAADLKQFLQAAQARNASEVQRLQPKIEQDARALQNFDERGLNAYEDQLFKSYADRYKQGMTQAGIKLKE